MQVTFWHRTAYLYQNGQLELSEIVKTCLIMTAIGVIEDDNPIGLGYNVLDNSGIQDAMLIGLLTAFGSEKPVSYEILGKLIKKHYSTAGRICNRLEKLGYIEKEKMQGRPSVGESGGNFYIVTAAPPIPVWVREFTQAIVDMELDQELADQVHEECKTIRFARGMEVLKQELREKFLPRFGKSPQPDNQADEQISIHPKPGDMLI